MALFPAVVTLIVFLRFIDSSINLYRSYIESIGCSRDLFLSLIRHPIYNKLSSSLVLVLFFYIAFILVVINTHYYFDILANIIRSIMLA